MSGARGPGQQFKRVEIVKVSLWRTFVLNDDLRGD